MSFPARREAESSISLQCVQPCRRFTFDEIQLATENFDESLVIGHGGFGKVYKGTISNGTSLVVAAIKRLDSLSSQGADEFWAEVEMLSNLRHCHLVSLFGYCNDGREMILVYEYMPNGTFEDHLHKFGIPLSWMQRLKICLGAARGLDYLHTGTGIQHGIIHRDVKSSNILLHESWAAKISDFGLSKVGPTNQPSTYVNTLIKGTFGYLDPDYFSTGRLTRKSDVYAFGVVLLEVLCGKQAVDRSLDEEEWGLVGWAQDHIEEGKVKQIIDPNLKGQISAKCLNEFTKTAYRCLHSRPKQRPTMAEIVVVLESVLALQEKANNSLKPAGGITIFGRKLPLFNFPSNGESSAEEGPKYHLGHLKRFSLYELQVATDNFSNKNILGQGGFGKVYKGRLADGSLVAVKRLKEERTQGGELQFQSEVEIRVAGHRNLRLPQGFCMTPTERLLVYPYMANGSVASCLRERPDTQEPLDWPIRKRIALGSARGLAYLHDHCDPKIIHRDVKAANILLDEEFEAVLGDFGLAKLMDYNDTHVTTTFSGTLRYIAPEYLSTGKCSEKTDVFGYGIVLLELITGQRAFDLARLANDDDAMLLDWVKGFLREKRLETLVDADLEGNYVDDEVEQLMQVALLCTQGTPLVRPKMSEVVRMLEGDGLAERWEEWQKEEMFRLEFNNTHNPHTDWNTVDSTDSLHSEELSSPSD